MLILLTMQDIQYCSFSKFRSSKWFLSSKFYTQNHVPRCLFLPPERSCFCSYQFARSLGVPKYSYFALWPVSLYRLVGMNDEGYIPGFWAEPFLISCWLSSYAKLSNIYWNPKAYYLAGSIQTIPPPSNLSKINFNNIHPLASWSS
jgi:hypothetical protein